MSGPPAEVAEACNLGRGPNSKNRYRPFGMAHKSSQVALLALLFSSCATLVAGEGRPVQINTVPQGATVYVNGQDSGQTPVGVALYPQDEIHLELEDYGPHFFSIGEGATQINPPFWVNMGIALAGVGIFSVIWTLDLFYASQTVSRDRLLTTGLISMLVGFNGVTVDILSGDMHRVAFKDISIELKQVDPGEPEQDAGG